MKNWLIAVVLASAAATTLLVLTAHPDDESLGTALPVATWTPLATPQPESTAPVVDVTDLQQAFNTPLQSPPFVSFDEPPLARPLEQAAENPAAENPHALPAPSLLPAAYLAPAAPNEVLPEPRLIARPLVSPWDRESSY